MVSETRLSGLCLALQGIKSERQNSENSVGPRCSMDAAHIVADKLDLTRNCSLNCHYCFSSASLIFVCLRFLGERQRWTLAEGLAPIQNCNVCDKPIKWKLSHVLQRHGTIQRRQCNSDERPEQSAASNTSHVPGPVIFFGNWPFSKEKLSVSACEHDRSSTRSPSAFT